MCCLHPSTSRSTVSAKVQTFAGTNAYGWCIQQAASQLVVDETEHLQRLRSPRLFLMVCQLVTWHMVSHHNHPLIDDLEYIAIIQAGAYICSPVSMFPRTYVPRYLCSPVPMFSRRAYLCSPVPMFPGTYVPRYLCSPVPMFPGIYVRLIYVLPYICSPVPIVESICCMTPTKLQESVLWHLYLL